MAKEPPYSIERHRKNAAPSRIVLYPKDIQTLTGKSYRKALDLYREVRNFFKKDKHHLLTLYEFADYTGIHPDDIIISLR